MPFFINILNPSAHKPTASKQQHLHRHLLKLKLLAMLTLNSLNYDPLLHICEERRRLLTFNLSSTSKNFRDLKEKLSVSPKIWTILGRHFQTYVYVAPLSQTWWASHKYLRSERRQWNPPHRRLNTLNSLSGSINWTSSGKVMLLFELIARTIQRNLVNSRLNWSACLKSLILLKSKPVQHRQS